MLEKKVSLKSKQLPWLSDEPKKKFKKSNPENHKKDAPESISSSSTSKNPVIHPRPLKTEKVTSEIKNAVPHPIFSVGPRISCPQLVRNASNKPKKARPGHLNAGSGVKKTRRMFRHFSSTSKNETLQPIRPVRSRPLLYIANSIVSWSSLPPLKSRPHSFQLKLCIQYVRNMLTTAAANPSYLKKLGKKKGLQPELFFDHLQNRCQASTNRNLLRVVLEEVSIIFRKSNDATEFKKGDIDIIKAIRVTMHALANLDS